MGETGVAVCGGAVVVVVERAWEVVVVERGVLSAGPDCATVALATSVLSPGPETSTDRAYTSALRTDEKFTFNVAFSVPLEQGKLSGPKTVLFWL
jgi:hypothetical protein